MMTFNDIGHPIFVTHGLSMSAEMSIAAVLTLIDQFMKLDLAP